MPTLEQKTRHVANLYWLAFLLTGARDESADMAVEAMDSPGTMRSFRRGCWRGRERS